MSLLRWRWGGADVAFQTREQWVIEVIQAIQKGEPSRFIRSGCYEVSAERDDDGNIVVTECKITRYAVIEDGES